MQAIAPSSNGEPHDGQTVGKGAGAGAATAPLDPLPAAGELGAGATGAAGFAAGLAAAGIMNGFLQDGQRTFLPPALSGTCIDLVQCGQRIICGITSHPKSEFRNPKFETNSNLEIRIAFCFGIRISNLFRISIFGFRILPHLIFFVH
jgi:hypothetical protein